MRLLKRCQKPPHPLLLQFINQELLQGCEGVLISQKSRTIRPPATILSSETTQIRISTMLKLTARLVKLNGQKAAAIQSANPLRLCHNRICLLPKRKILPYPHLLSKLKPSSKFQQSLRHLKALTLNTTPCRFRTPFWTSRQVPQCVAPPPPAKL